MTQSFTGGCACGAIRFECSVEPLVVFNCHCRDCQKATGAAFVTAIAIPTAALKMAGDPKYHSVDIEGGSSMSRGFCPECGTHLFARTSSRGDAMGIHLATLDEPQRYRPTMDIWTASAQPWDYMNPELPKFPKAPPPH